MKRTETPEIMVSVVVATYNQENYITDALDSILRQKTDYRYEIIVYDDASTDSTPQILREYRQRFPETIRLILMNENQMLKHEKAQNVLRDNILPETRGKYLAFCDGDDYWCDDNKMDFQVRFLETNPDYYATLHNTECVTETGEHKWMMCSITEDCDWSLIDEVLTFPHNSSYVFFNPWMEDDEECIKARSLIFSMDKSLQLYMLWRGKIRYFSKTMSKYRRMIYKGNSINAIMRKENLTRWKVFVEQSILRQINGYGIKVDTKLHYYTQCLDYARERLKEDPSRDNRLLYHYALKECPWPKSDYMIYRLKQSLPKGLKRAVKRALHRK